MPDREREQRRGGLARGEYDVALFIPVGVVADPRRHGRRKSASAWSTVSSTTPSTCRGPSLPTGLHAGGRLAATGCEASFDVLGDDIDLDGALLATAIPTKWFA